MQSRSSSGKESKYFYPILFLSDLSIIYFFFSFLSVKHMNGRYFENIGRYVGSTDIFKIPIDINRYSGNFLVPELVTNFQQNIVPVMTDTDTCRYRLIF